MGCRVEVLGSTWLLTRQEGNEYIKKAPRSDKPDSANLTPHKAHPLFLLPPIPNTDGFLQATYTHKYMLQ